ncbi:MAG: glutamine--fructose-6-phosphate aminotransferase [Candidatus Colwellbacteria bacterium RIFCSPLOWO2_01_FULL_48_10]|uniref:Glutamine--fructose-6-phosphate aminotransferase [isomerizing] n=2 Tax=Bacteria candidate phyla TaxID=1783234 RepID=A0A1F5NZ51_9BACT|nr:MAG: glutamine--fructose-6-phosphate aminotransferase [Candidatus Doudnabacteria bacterium RIFCSPHIGHO2_01_FULL_49_9]OGY60193.1 MAG: glutamine--fructose-6-phosphate aminotransferase [Candidatus Colwellbacteria bacterium RIFCSPLOWO2_01_FULL_48_10]
MCGIVGYVGKKNPVSVVVDGLRALEYRGYDSAGIAFLDNDNIKVIKTAGRVDDLVKLVDASGSYASIAMGHTRWATHGEPNDANAHPHFDCLEQIFIAHNGVIENYHDLKKDLIKRGHKFRSQTDTEVIAHLIEDEGKDVPNTPIEELVLKVLPKLKGTYGLVVMSKGEPNKMVAVRNFSPLLLGVGNNEYIIASDASPILKHTRQIIYLNDGEMAVVTPQNYGIVNVFNQLVQREVQHVDHTIEMAEKGNYPHFSIKEIMEQPDALRSTLRGRLLLEEGKAKLGGLEEKKEIKEKLRLIERLIITSCGTANLAGMIGKYMLEEYAGVRTEVDLASEFRYRKPILDEKTAVMVISQSGETADTIGALKEAKEKGVLTLGIVNVVGSSVARMTDAGVYNHAGPEVSVASYKAFTSQLAVLALYTLFLGRQRNLSLTMGKRIVKELLKIPDLVEETLKVAEQMKKIAEKYLPYRDFLFIGRKYNLATAYEGALKLKEVAYVHAEGYGSGEMKHGPLAMIDEEFPTVVIVPQDSVYEKNISNTQEIKARRGPIIAIATKGDKEIGKIVDDVIYIPKTLEMLTPILAVIPLQLFAYYSGVLRGLDVDKPRNLAKSVTVE